MESVQIASPDPENLTWFVFDPPNADECPEWLRTAALDQDGTAWACAAFLHDRELLAVLLAGMDREPAVMCDGHFYLRIPWMREQCPQFDHILAGFERGATLAYHAGSHGVSLH